MNRLDVADAIAKIRKEWSKNYAVNCALDDLEEALHLEGAGTQHRARASDPESSHEGARRIEPKVNTRKAEVLARLLVAQERIGAPTQSGVNEGWVSSKVLHTEQCGGAEGLRRLRELRADGWDIEVRHVGVGTDTEYRLRPIEQLTLV